MIEMRFYVQRNLLTYPTCRRLASAVLHVLLMLPVANDTPQVHFRCFFALYYVRSKFFGTDFFY